MKKTFGILVTLLLTVCGIGDAQAAITPSTGAVQPGQWNGNLEACKKYAQDNKLPLLAIWSTEGCHFCKMFQPVIETAEFNNWLSEVKPVMYYAHAQSYSTDRKNADWVSATGQKGELTDFPFVRVWWPAQSKDLYFTGRKANFGAKDLQPNDVAGQAVKLIEKIKTVFGDWRLETYNGGSFVTGTTDGSHLEAFAGAVVQVAVPVDREKSLAAKAAKNVITLSGAATGSVSVEWKAGESGRKYATVNVPSLTAGKVITLTLTDANDSKKTSRGTTQIRIVANTAGDKISNPMISGSDVGKWTTDFAAAKASKRYTLVVVSGVLWCPWCLGLERDVLNKDAFKTWAKNNNLSLVVIDNLKRSADDNVKTAPYSISTVANGAAPSLYSYAVGENGKSGAAFISRNGLSATACSDKLQANHNLGYLGGELCEPEAFRTGYPTVLLLDPNGKVRGRLNEKCEQKTKDATGVYPYDTNENIQRLKDLLALAKASQNENLNQYPSKTALTYGIGDAGVSASLSVNEPGKVFKLVGVPNGKVSFAVSGRYNRPVKLTVLKASTRSVTQKKNGATVATKNVATTTEVASGTESVDCILDSQNTYYLKVSSFADAATAAYGTTGTELTVSFTGSAVLMPSYALGSHTTTKDSVAMEIDPSKGSKYKLSGFTADSLAKYFTGPASGVYTLKSGVSGTIALGVDDPGRTPLQYRVWDPGSVAIDQTGEEQVFKYIGETTFTVTRKGGGSGACSVNVSVVGGDAKNGVRYDWKPQKLSWGDGETGTKTLTFKMKDYSAYYPNETVVLGLTDYACSEGGSASTSKYSLILCDTDKPVSAKTTYNVTAYAGFAASLGGDPLDALVYNVAGDGKVTVSLANRLPTGLKLVYNYDKDLGLGAIELQGSPKKPSAKASYSFTLSEKRGREKAEGPESTINLTVLDPNEVNPFVMTAIRKTIPLFAENELVGEMDFSQTKQGKLTLSYTTAAYPKKLQLTGQWADLDKDGTAVAQLEGKKNGALAQVTLTKDGTLEVTAYDASNLKGVTSGKIALADFDYSAFAGYYTVALPVAQVDGPQVVSYGSAYMTLTMTSKSAIKKGSVKYVVVYPDGKKASGTATLLKYDANFAALNIFASSGKSVLTAPLKIRINAALASSYRAVIVQDGCVAQWSYADRKLAFKRLLSVYGSYYPEDGSLVECCGGETLAQFELVADKLAPGRYGAFTGVPANLAKLIIEESKISTLEKRVTGLSFSFKRKTGIFSGKVQVEMEDKSVSCSFTGIIFPGWAVCTDCGKGGVVDTLIPIDEKPLGCGTCTFTDKVDGVSLTRGMDVQLNIIPEN